MILSFDAAAEALDAIAERFPRALFDGLNGGVNLVEEAQPDPEFPEGELYFMGAFCNDCLGRYINLYYGSFVELARREDWTREEWEQELRTTLSHELTHHLEERSGLHGLDDRDEADMAAFRREFESQSGEETQ